MHISLILPNGERRVHQLSGDRCTVGRRADCDIQIDLPSVSRLHAEFVRGDDGAWELRDLESLNGLEVDGRPIEVWRPAEGDEVSVGDARVFYGDAPQSDSTIILTRRRPARMWLDADHRCLRNGDEQVGERLAPREFDLLRVLSEAGGHVVARRALEEALWGADAYDDNALHQLVRRTREKIGDEAGSPKVLITLPGVGYRLDLDAAPAAS